MNLWERKRMQVEARHATDYGGVLADPSGVTQVKLMLRQHMRDLGKTQSFERKAVYKRKVLPLYEPWITETLKRNAGAQDDVLMYLMLWSFDAGMYEQGLDIAQYALKHQLSMPSGQSRTTGCAIAEEMGDRAKEAYTAKKPLPLAILQRTMSLIEHEDMPDKVRGELHKWLGYSLRDNDFPQPALCELMRALELNDRSGVKQDIKQLEKFLSAKHHADE
ncbi:phage terminase small subunit [Providencia alcalifaciens]|uniref:phage terminase small subunit n=1 Tax=Providencia alcalifaciens TaxID=126385 RepID=UPI001CC4A0CB|nr:phage terminase small subunit [Providencia alcalifaciens]